MVGQNFDDQNISAENAKTSKSFYFDFLKPMGVCFQKPHNTLIQLFYFLQKMCVGKW